eukprot:16219_1
MNFDNLSSMKPDKSIRCSKKKLKKGQIINLQKKSTTALKFKKTKYFALYIQSNQNNTESTYINSMQFTGHPPGLTDTIRQTFIVSSNSDNTISASKCDQKVSECDSLIKLSKILHEFSNFKNDKKDFYNKYCGAFVKILDYFNHFLAFHNKDDKTFRAVYQMCNITCDALQCTHVIRHTRDNSLSYNNKQLDNKIECFEDIMSTVHFHICHSYDVGTRITTNEQKQIDDIKEDDEKEKLFVLKNILKNKLSIYERITCSKISSRHLHKFCTNFYQSKIEENTATSKYSYSFPFNYKEEFKNSSLIFRGIYKRSDLYVYPKHETLKDELINNKLCCIGIFQWETVMETVKLLKETENARTIYARTQNYNISFAHELHHPIHFGYTDGFPLQINHLIVLRIYCGFDYFQNKFSATYRKTDEKQSLKDVVAIHSNFYHCGKYLKEAIEVFGTQYQRGKVDVVYHGINQEIIFSSTTAYIYGPLSTTSVWKVAIQFSDYIGSVIELVPMPGLKYFECDWISPFSREAELLFVGGYGGFHIVTVLNCQTGTDYGQYIRALRIIDTMTNNQYFMHHPSDVLKGRLKIFHDSVAWNTDVSSLNLANITVLDKKICVALMCHELYRNGYQTVENSINEFSNLDNYIEQLLHEICSNKHYVRMNWKAMNTNVLKKIPLNDFSCFGYIGYSFLKKLVCNEEYEGINLHVLQALFPNLRTILIYDLSTIDTQFLNDIYEMLRKVESINLIELYIDKEYNESNTVKQWLSFQTKFNGIGYVVAYWKDKTTQAYYLGIRKITDGLIADKILLELNLNK